MTTLSELPVIVAPGKILDYIDGATQRPDTPEEYVRQEIAKSLVREYDYDKSDIKVEFPIKFGSSRVRVDIVVFPPGEPHLQENARVLVECKKEGTSPRDRRDGIEQLKSYMAACGAVEFGMWTNGTELECFRMISEGGKRRPVSVPDIPKFGADEEELDRPSFDQLRAAASDSLLFAFRRSHDYIAGNQGLQKPEAFWELLKLIFCKIQDERYSSPRPEFYCSGSERSSMSGALKCKKRIDSLFADVRHAYPQIFKASEEIELEPRVVVYIVAQLQMLGLLGSDVDVKGKAYEEVVGSNLRGDRGEFFTPRNICRMMVAMVDPHEDHLTVDPACGTGGFLITAMNHVIDAISADVEASGRLAGTAERILEDRKTAYLKDHLVGIDFNPSLVKATKMNMVMNNDGSGGLFQANSLAPVATWASELRDRDLIGHVDRIVTNPPFGSKIPVDDPAILSRFELGHQWSYDERTDRWISGEEVRARPPEILFIERCVELLKPGTGVAAMVLPDGILGSPGLGYVRQWLLEKTEILASVDLHPDTFQPGTSVQTSVLVFRRKSLDQVHAEKLSKRLNDYPIFMAICDHVGHDKRGSAVFVRDSDGNEVIVETEDVVTQIVEGRRVKQRYTAQERLLDDNTQAIAEAFRSWFQTSR